jgi:hypothetical protein
LSQYWSTWRSIKLFGVDLGNANNTSWTVICSMQFVWFTCDWYFDSVVHFAFQWILQITFAGTSLISSPVASTPWTGTPVVL